MVYDPVSFEKFAKKALKDPEVLAAYAEFEEKFTLAAKLIEARKRVDKTQTEVAKKMETSQSVVVRIESAFGQRQHSPTLKTLKKYAHAVGCKLVITLTPKPQPHP